MKAAGEGRCDKRGQAANRDNLPSDNADWPDFFAWDNSVGDALAEWRTMIAQTGFLAARSGIFGHSEGGLLARSAEQQLEKTSPAPHALILAATPGRHPGDVVQSQLLPIMRRQRVPPVQPYEIRTRNAAIERAISATGTVPDDVPPGLCAVYPGYTGKLWHSERALNPPVRAAAIPVPVLLITGAGDQQVSARDDTMLRDQALAHRSLDDHQMVVLPRDTPLLMLPGTATTDPAALDAIAVWLSQRLRHEPGLRGSVAGERPPPARPSRQ